jgi:hypothetical protein
MFKCISTLAAAVGATLQRPIYDLLDPIFASGLSEDLRIVLSDLSTHIPSLLPIIQGNFVLIFYHPLFLFFSSLHPTITRKIAKYDFNLTLWSFVQTPGLSLSLDSGYR